VTRAALALLLPLLVSAAWPVRLLPPAAFAWSPAENAERYEVTQQRDRVLLGWQTLHRWQVTEPRADLYVSHGSRPERLCIVALRGAERNPAEGLGVCSDPLQPLNASGMLAEAP
jgi:hypothetical protein